MERIDRNNAAHFRINPEHRRIVCALRHRKHARGIDRDQVFGPEGAYPPYFAVALSIHAVFSCSPSRVVNMSAVAASFASSARLMTLAMDTEISS